MFSVRRLPTCAVNAQPRALLCSLSEDCVITIQMNHQPPGCTVHDQGARSYWHRLLSNLNPGVTSSPPPPPTYPWCATSSPHRWPLLPAHVIVNWFINRHYECHVTGMSEWMSFMSTISKRLELKRLIYNWGSEWAIEVSVSCVVGDKWLNE